MRLFLALIFVLFASALSAQLNDKHIYVDVETNILEEVYINSLFKPEPLNASQSLGQVLAVDPDPVSPGVYKLEYQSFPGFTGDIVLVMEYTEPSIIPGFPQTNYSTVHIRVKPSKIETEPDFELFTGSTATIHPLNNDSTSSGDLNIVKLGHVSGGTAVISATDAIDFTLTEDQGHILYFTEDSLGTVASALIHIQSENSAATSSSDLFVDNRDEKVLILPSSDFEIGVAPSNGTLSQSTTASHIWTYSPNQGYYGSDSFDFTNASGGQLDYTITVIHKPDSNSFLVDDEIYITTDGSLEFDVLANDLRSDFNIHSYSSELTEISNGVFHYSPPSGFTGDKVFEYKIFTGLQLFIANIVVHVDDFAPTTEIEYSYDLVENQPLRIIYNTPKDGFIFYSAVAPTNGTVVILDEFNQEITSCDTITGANTIIYTPNAGFTGLDEFDLEYCSSPSSGICEVLKVDVQVQSTNNTDCLCIEDCVFQGDHNDDGRVDVKDILDLGLNVGEGGLSRTQDFAQIWTGQFSNDWGFNQMNSDIDLKCGDSDGDSYIDENDVLAIEQFYGNVSQFQGELLSAISEVPVIFVPQQSSVDSGEVMVVDIIVGNSSFPAIDMHGLAFRFNINPGLIDSSSVNFYQYGDNWLSLNSPNRDFFNVPADGQIDIAVTRHSNGSADGFGIIGALEFIVEDEVTGLRRAGNIKESIVQLTDIISVNEFGEYSSHPDYEQIIQVNSDRSLSEEEAELTIETVNIYPNPSSRFITINSQSSMDKIELIDALGQSIRTIKLPSVNNRDLDIHDLQDGLYFIRISNETKSVTKKFNKVSL